MRTPPAPMRRLLFCHGLGCAKGDAQLLMAQWAQRKPIKLMQYKNYGDMNNVWSVNDWVRDIGAELAAAREGCATAADASRGTMSGGGGTIAVCVSAGAQALLRALWHSPHLAQNLDGLLLLSPAVGMELPNYVQRVLPNQWDALRAGLSVEHPSSDHTVRLRTCLDSLLDYERNCILRRDTSLPPLHFPVRIVHGLHDKLVPLANCVELLHRMPARDKAMHVVPCGHVITDAATVAHALDSLWAAAATTTAQIGRRRADNARDETPAAKVTPEALLG